MQLTIKAAVARSKGTTMGEQKGTESGARCVCVRAEVLVVCDMACVRKGAGRRTDVHECEVQKQCTAPVETRHTGGERREQIC